MKFRYRYVKITVAAALVGAFCDQNWLLYDKVTILESEKRAWESSSEAQAVREALNPWRNRDSEARKSFQDYFFGFEVYDMDMTT